MYYFLVAKRIIAEHRRGAFIAGIILGGLIFAIAAWIARGYILPASSYRGVTLYQSSGSYQYTDPLLACDIGSQDTFPELASLKAGVAALIRKDIQNGSAQNVSVYFRSLKSGRWFDINPDTAYTPASLFKVFVMMAYYKAADDEGNPGLLQKKITFVGPSTPAVDIEGKQVPHLIPGNAYTIADMIKNMIVYSDNDAAVTLVSSFDATTWKAFYTLFSDLQIPSPATQVGNIDPMSVTQYAMIFRVLFGSTYLSREYSEKALSVLSQTSYKSALVAGVPPDVTVAHKYGDAINPITQLHDCGIIYYSPEHPYLLCVMTSGSDFSSLQKVIKDISNLAHQRFATLYPKK